MASKRRWKSSDLEAVSTGGLRARTRDIATTTLLAGNSYTGTIIGIDPSLRSSGVALLQYRSGKPKMIFSCTIPTKGDHLEALGTIAKAIDNICKQYSPDVAAIEETIYAQNQKTAITLGATRGAILATLSLHQITCQSFSPTKIKSAIAGNGRASKEQIIGMTSALLNLSSPLSSDEADAAATALTLGYALR